MKQALRAAVLLVGFGASAQTWTLAWVRGPGAESCLDGAELSRAVELRLGRSPFTTEGALLLEGLVQREGEGWSAFVAIRDRHGATLGVREHHSDAPGCEALKEPLALIVALLIDPDALSAVRPVRSPERVPTPPVAALPAPPPKVEAPVEPPPSEPMRLALGATPTFGVGQLSDWTPGLRLEVSGRLGPVGLGLALEGWWPTRRSLGSGSARLGQVGLDLTLCPLWVPIGPAQLGACASAELGVLVVQGLGFATNRTTSNPVVDLGARGLLSWPMGERVALTLGVGLRGHAVPVTIAAVDSRGEIVSSFNGLPVAFDLGAGVRVRLRQ